MLKMLAMFIAALFIIFVFAALASRILRCEMNFFKKTVASTEQFSLDDLLGNDEQASPAKSSYKAPIVKKEKASRKKSSLDLLAHSSVKDFLGPRTTLGPKIDFSFSMDLSSRSRSSKAPPASLARSCAPDSGWKNGN